MEKIVLSSTEYTKFKTPDFEGNEGKLYLCNNQRLYKFYKHFWQYDINRLEKLIKLQKNIQHTTMPVGSICVDDIFVGAVLKYFCNHEKLIESKSNNLELIIFLLKQLKTIIKELTDNYIYLTDLDDENILVSKTGKLELIDLDGLDTIISDQTNLEALKKVLNLYKNIILDFLYPKYDKINCYGKEAEHLESIGLPNIYIDHFVKQDLSYEMLDDLIDQKYKTYRK